MAHSNINSLVGSPASCQTSQRSQRSGVMSLELISEHTATMRTGTGQRVEGSTGSCGAEEKWNGFPVDGDSFYYRRVQSISHGVTCSISPSVCSGAHRVDSVTSLRGQGPKGNKGSEPTASSFPECNAPGVCLRLTPRTLNSLNQFKNNSVEE